MSTTTAGPVRLRRHSLTLVLLSVPAVVVVRPANIQFSTSLIAETGRSQHTTAVSHAAPSLLLQEVSTPDAPERFGKTRLSSALSAPAIYRAPINANVVDEAVTGPKTSAAPRYADLQVSFSNVPPIAGSRLVAAGGAVDDRIAYANTHAGSLPQRWTGPSRASSGIEPPAHLAEVMTDSQPQRARRMLGSEQLQSTKSARPARAAARAVRTFAVAGDAWQQAGRPTATASAPAAARWRVPPSGHRPSGPSADTLWVDAAGLFAGADIEASASTATGQPQGGVRRFSSSMPVTAVASVATAGPIPFGTEPAFEDANLQVRSLLAVAGDSVLPLRPYEYVPSQAREEEPQRPPEQQRLVEMNLTGQYAKLGRDGLALMKKEKVDDELAFIIANGLAWSGRLHAAEKLYQDLLNSEKSLDARVALANISRWRGKDYLAASMYKEVLATDPDHEDAQKGLALSKNDLRPRLQVATTGTKDSYDVRTQSLGANYRWYTHEGARVSEVELSAISARMPQLSSGEALLTMRHQAHDVRMDPSVEVSFGKKIYGSISIQPTSLPVRVQAGKVDWGVMSLNPRGMKEALHANNLGVRADLSSRAGRASLVADTYRVSDGNSMQTALFRYSPPVKLITPHLRPLLGAEYRKAKFNSPAYWSPEQGYAVAFAGVEGEWSGERWNTSASVQRGWRIQGEAGPSWGAALATSYKINPNWSVGARALAISNKRDGGGYRANSATVYMERRW